VCQFAEAYHAHASAELRQERDQLRAWKSSRESLEHDAKRLADLLAEEEDKSARLRVELDGARETAKTMIVAQLEKVAGLRAEVESLRQLLLKYGGHTDTCSTFTQIGSAKECPCGWLQARAALDSAQPAQERKEP
jgi:predicted RNase H-like nuclease (RuvC/YqgF family)